MNIFRKRNNLLTSSSQPNRLRQRSRTPSVDMRHSLEVRRSKHQLLVRSSRWISLQGPARTCTQYIITAPSSPICKQKAVHVRVAHFKAEVGCGGLCQGSHMRKLPDTSASLEQLCMLGRDWSFNLKTGRRVRTGKGSTFERVSILGDHCHTVSQLKISCCSGYYI